MDNNPFFDNCLQNIAIIKLASNYFKINTIRESLKSCVKIEVDPFVSKQLLLKLEHRFLKNILCKVNNSCLPAIIKNALKDNVTYMAHELTRWLYKTKQCYFTDDLVRCIPHLLDSLEWSAEGRVDVARTVRNMLLDTTVANYQKFLLSCVFCFKEEAEQLWLGLPDEHKLEFKKLSIQSTNGSNLYLIYGYWLSYFENKDFQSVDMLVDQAILNNNISILKFFWKKVQVPNVSEHFTLLDINNCADILYFFVSQGVLTQKEMSEKRPCFVLCVALNIWPVNNYSFCSLLSRCDPYLKPTDPCVLLEHFMTLLPKHPSSINLKRLLRTFWEQYSSKIKLGRQQYWPRDKFYFKAFCVLNDIDALDMYINDIEFDSRVDLFKNHLPEALKLMGDEKYEVLYHVVKQVYKTDEKEFYFKIDFVNTDKDCILKAYIKLGDLHLLEILKTMTASSDELWDQVITVILQNDGHQILLDLLEKLGATVFIEFLDYFFSSSSESDNNVTMDKRGFVFFHSETILYHIFENSLERNDEQVKLFLNCYFYHSYLITELVSVIMTYFDNYDINRRRELYELCSLTDTEELGVELDIFCEQWKRELKEKI